MVLEDNIFLKDFNLMASNRRMSVKIWDCDKSSTQAVNLPDASLL